MKRQYKPLIIVVLVLLLGLLALTVLVQAAPSSRPQAVTPPPALLNYQGMLGDDAGNPLTGQYEMAFALYALAEGGTALWQETQAVTVTNGLFNVYLGDVTPLSETVFDGQNLYLGVTVGTDDEMTPRLRIASVPYAFGAQQQLCTSQTWYFDGDRDGYGDPTGAYQACERPPNHVENNADCDDTDPGVNPATPWYEDGDGDGYGNPTVSQVACEAPAGYVINDLDCDDANLALNPETFWYADVDNDTYGDPGSFQQVCEQPAGYVANNLDCDDGDSDVNPEGQEVCDGVDNDCDAHIDESEDLTPPLCDMQAGVCSNAVKTCGGAEGWLPCGWMEYGPDYQVDETRCDSLDNDCDALVDEGCP
ncbi:MAG: putative metal-binding motif-containing protein [Anaerolineae bacterium]|nr:putative metal-binding motif-containing protein [Anaerolineae bacterium]